MVSHLEEDALEEDAPRGERPLHGASWRRFHSHCSALEPLRQQHGQPPPAKATKPRWRRRQAEEAEAAEQQADENRDPLELRENWGVDDASAGFSFAEKGNRLAPGRGGRWTLLEEEQKSEQQQAPSPQRQQKSQRRRLPAHGRRRRPRGQPQSAESREVMKAQGTLSSLAREQRQFRGLTVSLRQMTGAGRPTGNDLEEAWRRAAAPEKGVAEGGLVAADRRSANARRGVMTMAPTSSSWLRCGGGVGVGKARPQSQQAPAPLQGRTTQQQQARSRSAPLPPVASSEDWVQRELEAL